MGKSAVVALLAGLLADGAICEVDRFRAMFARLDWGSRQQHEMALRAAIAACRSLLDDGVSPVVIVDVFGRDSLARVASSLRAYSIDPLAVSLWAAESVLFERLAKRAVGFQDRQLAALINEEVRSLRLAGDLLFDTTELEPMAVALALAGMLADGPAIEHAP